MALDLVKDYSYLGILYGATFSMNEIMQLCLLPMLLIKFIELFMLSQNHFTSWDGPSTTTTPTPRS